jgi:pimeloyl-ACP methyl ester carboxylesterase
MLPDPTRAFASPRLVRLSDGGRLAVAILGGDARTTAPFLLLRPLGGSMRLWGDFAVRLAATRPVVAFDPRGVGWSSEVPRGHTTRAMAGDARDLLDALGIARAHVFGVSLGGMVAAWLAADAPTRIASLTLASTLSSPAAVSWRALGRAGGFARCFLRRGVEAELCLVRHVLSPRFRAEEPARVAEIERQIRAAPAHRRDLLRLVLAAARHEEPRSDGTPLLLFGGDDPLAGPDARASLERRGPGATLEVLPGVGHDLTLEAPDATAARLISFVTRAAPPARRTARTTSEAS